MRNMEGASSANGGDSRRIFDSILDPFESESESQLGSTRDRATSGQRQESRESVDSILKRLDKGPRGKSFRFSGKWTISNTNCAGRKISCRAQDFQEHVQERLVSTIPYTSINYIIFSYRRGDVFACNSPSNIGSTNSTVAVLGYIQSSETLQMRAIHQNWMNGELSWKVMVGGLCGSEEFNREILDHLPGWTRVVAFGDLRLNNAGRLKVFV